MPQRRNKQSGEYLQDWLDKTLEQNTDKCILFKGALDNHGYGKVYIRTTGKLIKAHRYIFEKYNSCVLDSLVFVCHSCDNTACVNKMHLFAGSNQDNVTDMMNKKRNTFGEKNGKSKLNELQVREIKNLYLYLYLQGFTQKYISIKYGVVQSLISKLLNGKSWKHIDK